MAGRLRGEVKFDGVRSFTFVQPGVSGFENPEFGVPRFSANGTLLRVSSRRGSVVAPAFIDPGLRPGVVFMTLHFPDDVATNRLTIDVSDPKSGTAEFKACAVRVARASVSQLASEVAP